jgi:hypothetical protein
MAAIVAPLTQDMEVEVREHQRAYLPVKGGAMIRAGATVARDPNTGVAYPAGAASTDKIVGVAEEFADNTDGADGATNVRVMGGGGDLYARNNNAGDPVDATCIGKVVYAPDDNSVSKTSNGGAYAPAGIMRDFGPLDTQSGDVPWIEFGYITF